MGTIPVQTRSLAADWAVWTLQASTALAATALTALFTWYVRRQQRHDLAGLDDRALKDVGLTRADVAREVDKPFWR